jgi:hypothetical protein
MSLVRVADERDAQANAARHVSANHAPVPRRSRRQPDEQWAKLRLVVETAQEVWG